jgi:hypothetical protein
MKKHILVGAAPFLVPFVTLGYHFDEYHQASIPQLPAQTLRSNPTSPLISGNQIVFKAYLTSWAAYDNTPSGSDIQFDGTHSGGSGTYADPISMASGYVLQNGDAVFDYPIGTIFYVPNLQKYFRVSDQCGGDNGANPANTPCHKSEEPPYPQLDLWAGNVVSSKVTNCEDQITGVHVVMKNAAPGYKVSPGHIYSSSGCATQYGDTVVKD